MSYLTELRREYKMTWDAYKEAREDDNKELMKKYSHDLVQIADQMEYHADD